VPHLHGLARGYQPAVRCTHDDAGPKTARVGVRVRQWLISGFALIDRSQIAAQFQNGWQHFSITSTMRAYAAALLTCLILVYRAVLINPVERLKSG